MKSGTSGQHSFAQIPRADIPRSTFNRSRTLKTTFDSGLLIPILCEEALPGDTLNLNMSTFGRLATPLKPVMDNMYLDSFFFAVPIRLIWDNWQKFNGEQANPGDSTDYVIPETSTAVSDGSSDIGEISDYFGIPTGIDITVNALHHRAYNLIWNEYFRDQNLQDSITVNKGDGPDPIADYSLQRRGKRHDYMTSCLPFPQKGTAVQLPLGSSAPVIGVGDLEPTFQMDGDSRKLESAGGGTGVQISASTTNNDAFKWENTRLETDLTSATAATINQLRQAFQVQRLLERDARGGSRYTEIIRAHWGVTSPDQRLQRPEYLGGGSQNITIHAVSQMTDEPIQDRPLGRLAGYGTTQGNNHSFIKSFDEHCVIIGLVCARADLTYQQGLPRMFSRRTRFDYYWPALAHLGEQAVLNKEIYAQGDAFADDENVFGYQERYAEYRYGQSLITGEFRSDASQSLDVWHLAQDFGNLPVLDSDFIEENPPFDRVVAIPDEPEFLLDCYFSMKHARAMPTFGTPGLIDHF